MKTIHTMITIVTMWLLSSGLIQADEATQQLLKKADSYRQEVANTLISSQITTYHPRKATTTKAYDVYLKGDDKTLVLFQAASEKGQKMLMLGENFYLILPTSRRPVRITPMQKLLGEASTGDIANLTLAGDYDGQIIEQTDQSIRLDLIAQRKGLSYHRIELWLDRQRHYAQRANLYLASGKLAKRAEYHYDLAQNRIVSMKLVDAIQTDRWSQIDYLQQTPITLPDRVFNPQFLVANPNWSVQ